MKKPAKLRLSNLDTCLLAFEVACPQPSPEQIEAWCKQFPEFAVAIREHAQFVEPPIARGSAAVAKLSESQKSAAREQALKIMAQADALRLENDRKKQRDR